MARIALSEALNYTKPLPPPRSLDNSFDKDAAGRGQEVFDGKDECSMWHVPPQFLEPGWNAHKPEEIGIDDFQASRSPNMQCRTTPLRSFFVRMKDEFYYDGHCHTTLRM